MKVCVNFSFIRFYISFYIFIIVYRLTIKSLFNILADFVPNFIISLYFSSNSSFFIKKDIYLVLSKSFLYALILEHCTLEHRLFPIKYLFYEKVFCVRNYYFTNIYNIYQKLGFSIGEISTSILSNVITSLPILCMVINFFIIFILIILLSFWSNQHFLLNLQQHFC